MKLDYQCRRATSAMVGAIVLASCLGAAQSAVAAASRHHHRAVGRDFNALVDPNFGAPGPSIGAWRFKTFRRGDCDSAYPMHESYPCGSPTGGPVGGMGS